MRQAAVIATLLSAAALAAGAAGPADAATPACHLITPAQAHDALGGSVLLRRGEDSTLCNIEYGKPRRDLIMALNPNRPAPRGYTAVKCAYRTRTYTDESYTKVTTTQARLSIPGAIGFEAEIFTKPFTGELSADPDHYLILLRHGRILSFETTLAFKPATFAQLEQLAKAAMKHF